MPLRLRWLVWTPGCDYVWPRVVQEFGKKGFVMRVLRSSYDINKVKELEAELKEFMEDLKVRASTIAYYALPRGPCHLAKGLQCVHFPGNRMDLNDTACTAVL
jgi:hypothetical protein